jgi:hypothetical protein
VPTDKRQPPSTINSRIDELKQFLLPTGINSDQCGLLASVVEATLGLMIQLDGRDRRFFMLVLTREDNNPRPLISTDLIADVDMDVVRSAMRDWLAAFDADR